MQHWSRNRWVMLVGVPLMALGLASCSEKQEKQQPAVPVSAIKIIPHDIIIYDEFVGEVRGSQEVELRSRVTGVLLKQQFEDGVVVEEGQLLYSIDDRDLKAKVGEAEGAVASAQSNLSRARLDVQRYAPLLKADAVSKQVYDNAVAAQRAAKAQVESAKANLRQAELNVGFASIVAPVSGRIGASIVEEGDLIRVGTTLLARISNTDPAWVYFSVSETKLLEYERIHGVVGAVDGDTGAEVSMYLSDGSIYRHKGRINFTDRAVDVATGTYRLRAEFPNPDQELKPGMFARIRVNTDKLNDVVLVPDKAVTQTLDRYFVNTIDDKDKAEKTAVKLGRRQDGIWIIDKGVKVGDRVVVEGIQKAQPGTPLKVDMEPNKKYFDNDYVSESQGGSGSQGSSGSEGNSESQGK